jgi:hypothetical protein
MQPLPSWISPLTLQIAPNLKKSPSTERQRRENPHENQERQNLQQQGDGAGISRIAGPRKGPGFPNFYGRDSRKTYIFMTNA